MKLPLLILLLASACVKTPLVLASAQDACVRLTSHGASATCIYRTQTSSILLSCAHAFEGKHRTTPITLSCPNPNPAQPMSVHPTLLALDPRADLALISVNVRLPYCTPVAPAGSRPTRLLSCGYDKMCWPAVCAPATALSTSELITWTREAPEHGRSGGGLIDPGQQLLYGVVSGYEGQPNRRGRGIYVSHRAILAFVSRGGLPEPLPQSKPYYYQESPGRYIYRYPQAPLLGRPDCPT